MWYVLGVFIAAMVIIGLMILVRKPKPRIVQGRMEPIQFEDMVFPKMELPPMQGRAVRMGECQSHHCGCKEPDPVEDAVDAMTSVATAIAVSSFLTEVSEPEPNQSCQLDHGSLDAYREAAPVTEQLDTYVETPVAEVTETSSFSYDGGSPDVGGDFGGGDCGGGADF